jgi:hypothetical protein
MTDRAADNGVGYTTTNHQRRAAAAALAASATAAAIAEARAMVAVKVLRTSDKDEDDATKRRSEDATTQRRDHADDANDDADREGWRRMDDATARRRRGVVLPASLDGWRGARLCPAATAPPRRDDDYGRYRWRTSLFSATASCLPTGPHRCPQQRRRGQG